MVRRGPCRAAGPATEFQVQVTNTGARDADDVVLGFLTPPDAGKHGAPLKSLFAFERIHVAAGATVSVTLYPTFTDLTAVTAGGARVARPGEYTVSFGVGEAARHGMGFVTHRFVAE